jgi:hypothetical protein
MCGESDDIGNFYYCSDDCQLEGEKNRKNYPYFSKDFFGKIFPLFKQKDNE